MCAREYRPSLDTLELVVELQELLQEQRQTERLICRYLADLADRFNPAMALVSGFSDVYHLARRRFGLGFRATRERIRVGRALRELPATEEALVSGELSYSRVREVTRVARPEDEVTWLEDARRLSIRQLEQRVVEASERQAEASAAAGDGESPNQPAAKPSLAGLLDRHCIETRFLSPKRMEVRMTLSPDAWALVERALEGARRASEQSLSVDEALAAVARDALARQAEGPAELRRTVVLYECEHCRRVELDNGGQPMDLAPAVAASLGCGASVIDLEREGQFVQRGGPMPAAVRRAVLLRDRHRCRVPGCQLHRYVDVHHLHEQSRGGVHSRKNCLCLCERHHRMLHEGRLRIEGNADARADAPDRVRFAHADGEPFDDPRDWLRRVSSGGFMGGAPADARPTAPANSETNNRTLAQTHCGSDGDGEGEVDPYAAARKQCCAETHCGSEDDSPSNQHAAASVRCCAETHSGSEGEGEANRYAAASGRCSAQTHSGFQDDGAPNRHAAGSERCCAETHCGSDGDVEQSTDEWSKLTPEASKLLAVMGRRGGWNIDPLCEASGLSVTQVLCAITTLELAGRARRDWTGVITPLR